MSSVQPPCSGWPANARLFTASHVVVVLSDDEVPHGDAVGPPRRRPRGGSGTRISQQLAFEHEPAARGLLVVLVVVDPEGDVTSTLTCDDVRPPAGAIGRRRLRSPGRTATSAAHSSALMVREVHVAVAPPSGPGSRMPRSASVPRPSSPVQVSSPNGLAPDAASTSSASARIVATSSGANSSRTRASGCMAVEGIGPVPSVIALVYGANLNGENGRHAWR